MNIIKDDLIKNGNDPYYAYPHLKHYSLEEAKKQEYYPFIYALNIQNKIPYPDELDQPDLEVHKFCWEQKIREFNERWATGLARFISKCDAVKVTKKKQKHTGFGATINFMRPGDDEVGSLFIDAFQNFCKSKEIKNYYVAIEYGKNNNNPHAHIYLDYYDRRKSGGGAGCTESAKPRSLRYELHKLLPFRTDIQVQHNPRKGSWYQYCTKEESPKKVVVEKFQ